MGGGKPCNAAGLLRLQAKKPGEFISESCSLNCFLAVLGIEEPTGVFSVVTKAGGNQYVLPALLLAFSCFIEYL